MFAVLNAILRCKAVILKNALNRAITLSILTGLLLTINFILVFPSVFLRAGEMRKPRLRSMVRGFRYFDLY